MLAAGPCLSRFVLGGRQFNTIATLESGRTIAVTSGGANRPNVVAGRNPNSGARCGLRGTCAVHLRQRVAHDSQRDERRGQFRAEAFNLTNTPVFETPGIDRNSTTFGVVTATAFSPKPREMQLALKLTF